MAIGMKKSNSQTHETENSNNVQPLQCFPNMYNRIDAKWMASIIITVFVGLSLPSIQYNYFTFGGKTEKNEMPAIA